MAVTAYLDIDQGSDFSTIITLESDDGSTMNLTGYTIYSQFRKSYNSTIGYSFECQVVDAINGQFSLSLSGVQSSLIKSGRYLYDVEIYNSGKKTRVVEGVLTISPEITKIP